jgi:hypothetical protein
MPEFYGNHEMIVQCKDSTKAVTLDDPFAQEFLEIRVPALELDENMRKWLEQQSQNMQVENAYRNLLSEEIVTTAIDSSAFYGQPDNRYFLDDYTRFPVMEEVMREYVYYVNVRKNSDGFHFRVNDLEFEVIYEDNPLMLLDGVPVFDADDIIALDPLKIEKIETIIRAYSRGYLDCHGLVSYSSYDGDMAGYSPPDNALRLEYEGMQVHKKYTFPDYSDTKEQRNRIPDFRNTLFWLPDGIWDTRQNLLIDIFTSDDKDKYRIRINGMGANGDPYSAETDFSVR